MGSAERLREALHRLADAVADVVEELGTRAPEPPAAARPETMGHGGPRQDRNFDLAVTRADAAEMPPTVTVEEAAEFLRVPRSTIYHAVHAGYLPHVRLGRRIFIPREGLLGAAGQLGGK